MRIDKKYVDIAIEATEKEAKERSVIFNSKDLEEFKKTLKSIAAKSKYEEGQEMSKEDVDTIASGMDKVFDGVAQNFAQMDNNFKKKADLSHYPTLAYKHLISLTMKELNCPEISQYAFYNSVSMLARKMSREMPTKDLFVETAHKEQRRMDAKDVRDRHSVDRYMSHIKFGLKNTDEIGSLYAEYRALSIRQENHTAIWRFFHREENEARTNLLNEMKETLETVIPAEMLAAKPSAKEVLQHCEWSKTKTFIPQFLNSFDGAPGDFFGYSDYQKNPELYEAWKRDAEKSKESDFSKQIAEDTKDKVVTTTEQIKEEPTIASSQMSVN